MADPLDCIAEVLLMGPGPSCVPDSVIRAMAKNTIGHLDVDFIRIMDDLKRCLRDVMRTENRLTLPLSGTGSAGMEAAFVNLVEPNDPVLILANGVFGLRMQEVAGRLGAKVDTVSAEWGRPIEVDAVRMQVGKKDYKIVAVVHAETSTGVRNPVGRIGRLMEQSQSLFVVDAVTSLGGMEVSADAWGADVVYSGTQKCLSCPPGLAPVTFSERAVSALKNRRSKVPNWYLDLSMIVDYWQGDTRTYHHTAPVNMLYALHRALTLILEEGLEAVWKRHLENHQRLVAGLESLGLHLMVDPEWRLPMLNAVNVPAGIDEASVRRRLREAHRIEIGAGLGPLAGKIWRIGLMGHTARPENVDRLLDALASALGPVSGSIRH
jgi:alanine-glyoxylate transaminase/serine-glyoxylate transaminase/serine-pyruvate transaminase